MTKTLPQIIASLREGEEVRFQAAIGQPVIAIHFTIEGRGDTLHVGIRDIECASFGFLELETDKLITRVRLTRSKSNA
jgi:hypothetical protein